MFDLSVCTCRSSLFGTCYFHAKYDPSDIGVSMLSMLTPFNLRMEYNEQGYLESR
jgi:hypothetical protein